MTLDEFGLNTSRLIAGFAGGVVHTFVFKQTGALAAVGSVLTGTLTANFLGEAAGRYMGGWVGDGGSPFYGAGYHGGIGLGTILVIVLILVLLGVL